MPTAPPRLPRRLLVVRLRRLRRLLVVRLRRLRRLLVVRLRRLRRLLVVRLRRLRRLLVVRLRRLRLLPVVRLRRLRRLPVVRLRRLRRLLVVRLRRRLLVVAPASTLTIQNTTFSSASGFAGSAFSIVNDDAVAHTVTDSAGAFDLDIPANGTASLTITQPGTYQIHCRIHSSMKGTITVG